MQTVMIKNKIFFLSTLVLGTPNLFAADATNPCKIGPEWVVKSETDGKFLENNSDTQKAKLYVLKEDDSAMSEKNYLAILTLENANNCLLKYEGKRDPQGNTKVPTQNSSIFAVALTETRDALRVIDSYSHGYTQETTYILLLSKGFGNKISVETLWSGLSHSINPFGDEVIAPMAHKLDPKKKLAVVTHQRKGKILKWIWNPQTKAFSVL